MGVELRLCAGLLGLDLSWFMDGAGPALGDLGARRLSTSMLMAPEVSAQVAPSFVVARGLIGCGGWLDKGCSSPTPADKFCDEIKYATVNSCPTLFPKTSYFFV